MTPQSSPSIGEQYNAYIEQMEFEEKEKDSLILEDILSIEQRKGILIPTSASTDLWINRKVAVLNILGIPTVMESAMDEFELRDSFGMVIWSGSAEEIFGFVEVFSS